jgi:hypothetical protein
MANKSLLNYIEQLMEEESRRTKSGSEMVGVDGEGGNGDGSLLSHGQDQDGFCRQVRAPPVCPWHAGTFTLYNPVRACPV